MRKNGNFLASGCSSIGFSEAVFLQEWDISAVGVGLLFLALFFFKNLPYFYFRFI